MSIITTKKFLVLGLVKPPNAKFKKSGLFFELRFYYVPNANFLQNRVFFYKSFALRCNANEMQKRITFRTLFFKFVSWDQNFSFILGNEKIMRNEKFFFAFFSYSPKQELYENTIFGSNFAFMTKTKSTYPVL